MIGALISGLFNFLLDLVGTIIQVICIPINALIVAALPDISSSISSVGAGITNLFNTLPWALSILPTFFLDTLLFCYGIRLVVSSVSISTHSLVKVWNVLQKIKFW